MSLPGVVVDGVEPLVDLDLEQDVLLPRLLDEGLVHDSCDSLYDSLVTADLVLGEGLDHGLGGHHVEAALQGRQDDVEVGVIGSEHGAHVPGPGLRQGLRVGLPVDLSTLH